MSEKDTLVEELQQDESVLAEETTDKQPQESVTEVVPETEAEGSPESQQESQNDAPEG
jgi:hypothetical protein